jgi:hypothetical protein
MPPTTRSDLPPNAGTAHSSLSQRHDCIVISDEELESWKADADLLARIGRILFDQQTDVEVRLPRALADQLVAIWERTSSESELPPSPRSRGGFVMRPLLPPLSAKPFSKVEWRMVTRSYSGSIPGLSATL